MKTFYRLLEQSTLVSGAIALMLVATACYCAITSRVLPDYIIAAIFTVTGYFFAEKAGKVRADKVG